MLLKTAFFLWLFLSLLIAGHSHGAQRKPTSEEGQICLGCHGGRSLRMTFENGAKFSLFVDDAEIMGSVHGFLDCSHCHRGFSIEKHPQRNFKNLREFKTSSASACRMCHTFEKGTHAKMLFGLKDTVCTDCHGSHGIRKMSERESCLGCHSKRLALSFEDGETMALMVNAENISNSVHNKLRCNNCHFGFSIKEHPERKFKSRRDLTITLSESCRRCHFDKYTRTLEGIHYDLLSRGNLEAPVCVDCHGSHNILSGRKEKLMRAKRCEKCHPDIYGSYVKSVHGEALLSEHNQDVPICSDCHRAHDIEDPRTVDFSNMTPEICGKCHSNENLMSKYGLSTSVLQSYLEDFHGVTLTFYRKQGQAVRHIAVCTDCHGIHDITSVKQEDPAVLKARLLQRCRKCHPDATEKFPSAWISHYEPTLTRAPLVYAVNLIYKLFIPFMIAGLMLQIVLHIWRYASNR